LGFPIGKGDVLEIGYSNFTFFGEYTYLTLVYSSQISSSEGERTAFNFGAIFYHYGGNTGWGGTSLPRDGTFPVLLYEQERNINNIFSWLINFGIPNLIGFGLKYYL